MELILRESRKVLRVGREVLIVDIEAASCWLTPASTCPTPMPMVATRRPCCCHWMPMRRRHACVRRCATAAALTASVLIIDSIGRAWRRGNRGPGARSVRPAVVVDLRGRRDLHGRVLRSSDLAHADELAAAASMLMGQADEGRPIVHVRGLQAAMVGASEMPHHCNGPRTRTCSGEHRRTVRRRGRREARARPGQSVGSRAANSGLQYGRRLRTFRFARRTDLDSVMYAMAGLTDPQRGWGRVDETWAFMDSARALGLPDWFNLGDRDLATHVLRTERTARRR